MGLIKRSEGFRSQEYRDVAGFRTVGYGHRITGAESFPAGVSETQAAGLLLNDIRAAEQSVGRLVRVELTQGQFDALVDFCFNLGAGRLAASSLLRELNAGNHEAAGRQLMLWDHAAGQVNLGLKDRRQAELELWNSGEAARESAA